MAPLLVKSSGFVCQFVERPTLRLPGQTPARFHLHSQTVRGRKRGDQAVRRGGSSFHLWPLGYRVTAGKWQQATLYEVFFSFLSESKPL